MDTALKEDVQIRHPKEDIGRLAGRESVKYCVWIENEDCIVGSSGKSVNASEETYLCILGNGRYRCRLFHGEREICSVHGWNKIDVETAAANEVKYSG